jgi:hypothetical protein
VKYAAYVTSAMNRTIGPLPLRAPERSIVALSAIFTSALLVSKTSHAEPFVGQFELKTLESAPGSHEFQSQNAWSWNQPRRRVVVDDEEILADENSLFRERYALELEIGLTHALKMRIGVELENERVDEVSTIARANEFEGLKLEEIGAEIVAIVIPREGDGMGLGFVAEVEGPIDLDGPNNLIVGPIVEYRSGPWFFAAVPTLVRTFGGDGEDGEGTDDKWDFAYASQIMYRWSDRWALALEGYGTIERLGDSGRPSEAARLFGDSNQHRLGPVVYYEHSLAHSAGAGEDESPTLTVGLGLLEGLSSHTPDHTLKLSIEVDF